MPPVKLMDNKTSPSLLERSYLACYREINSGTWPSLSIRSQPEGRPVVGRFGTVPTTHLKDTGRGRPKCRESLLIPDLACHIADGGVSMRAWLSEPHDIRRPPETGLARRGSAYHGDLPNILTCLITGAIRKGKPEVKRAGNPGSASAWCYRAGYAVIACGRYFSLEYRIPRRRPALAPRARHTGAGPTGSQPEDFGRPNATPVVFWQALNPVERDAFRLFAFSRTFSRRRHPDPGR